MEVISRKWAILIVNIIGNGGTVRYRDIKEMLGGINSKTLSDRLKELAEFGLVRRVAYPEIPPRVEYSLTDEGMALRKSLMPLLEWVYHHDSGGKGATPCDVAHDMVRQQS